MNAISRFFESILSFYFSFIDFAFGWMGLPEMLAEVLVANMLVIGALSFYKLFTKCGKKPYTAFIPIYNLGVLMEIIGRPKWHLVYFLIPGYNLYIYAKTCIELCDSFGKHKTSDYILCILLSGPFVLNLGLSYGINYYGPKGANEQALKAQEEQENFKITRSQLQKLRAYRRLQVLKRRKAIQARMEQERLAMA